MKRLLLLCGLAALLIAPAATGGRSAATVSANPNPIVVGETVQWSGCGYKANALLWLTTVVPGGSEYEIADASGCFVSRVWATSPENWAAGTLVVSIYDASNTGGRPKGNALATASVEVVGATL